MNIFLYGNDMFFTKDMAWGFKELGHNVIVRFPSSIEEYDQIISDFNPDLIMTLGSPAPYNNFSLLYHIGKRKTNSRYVHWDTDGITWAAIELNLMQLTKPDIIFTICPEMLELLKEQDIRCCTLPYAYNPQTHFPCPRDESLSEIISFSGGAYMEMMLANPNNMRIKSFETLITPLLKNNIRVDFWGDARFPNMFKNFFDCDIKPEWNHNRCDYSFTNNIYNSCFINIVPQNHNKYLTKRTYEILGSGGFILTYATEEIHTLFTPQKEMAVSYSPQQTLELVKYYRNNPKEYEKIRKNALLAALNQTYKQRAEYIISML